MKNVFKGLVLVFFAINTFAQTTNTSIDSTNTSVQTETPSIDSTNTSIQTTTVQTTTVQTTTIAVDSTNNCVDKDGNSYPTVKIGNQTWMAQNLRTTHFNDGTEIPLMSDVLEWRGAVSAAFSWYDKEPQKYQKDHGALYNFFVIETNNICPIGWHVPSDKEWRILVDYNGGTSGVSSRIKKTGFPDINKIKATENEKTFNALASGSRDMFGHFFGMGIYATWWSSTKVNDSSWAWYIDGHDDQAYRILNEYKTGLSVRCLKNKDK